MLLHDAGSHLEIFQSKIQVVCVKVHLRRHQEGLSKKNRIIFLSDSREGLHGHVDVDRLEKEQDEVVSELLVEVATPDVGIVNEESVNCTVPHVTMDKGLPLLFADDEPHRQPVAVKNYPAGEHKVYRQAPDITSKMTYKTKLRSSRDTFDTALKKGLGGMPLCVMNVATDGCSFDK